MNKLTLLYLVLFIIISACSKDQMLKQVKPSDHDSKVILVAVFKDAQSSFKLALIDSLQAAYGKDYTIKTLCIKEPEDLGKEEYRVLIAMDELKAWLAFNAGMKRLMKQSNSDNAIFYITAGDPKWHWKDQHPYHLASASKPANLPQAWHNLKQAVDTILSSKN